LHSALASLTAPVRRERRQIASGSARQPGPAGAGGEDDGAGRARGRGGRQAAHVGQAAARQDRAHGLALAGLLDAGEDVGQEPGRRFEHVGAERAHGPQELAVLDDLGLAAEAPLDVAPLGPAEHRHPVGGTRQAVRQVCTLHG
jgi:hypothetical protein